MRVRIKGVLKRVESLLRQHPHLRDSDEKLICNIWAIDVKARSLDIKSMPAMEFLKLFSEKYITHPESIRRSRAALQAKHQDLRGKTYNERHSNQTEIVTDLTDLKNG